MKMIFLSWARRIGERRLDPLNHLSDKGISGRQQYSKQPSPLSCQSENDVQKDIVFPYKPSDKPLFIPIHPALHPGSAGSLIVCVCKLKLAIIQSW